MFAFHFYRVGLWAGVPKNFNKKTILFEIYFCCPCERRRIPVFNALRGYDTAPSRDIAMMMRGRGTMTVRKSENPFFQPSSQDFGRRFDAGEPFKEEPQPSSEFQFLYQRVNDDIGKGIVSRSDSKLSESMAKTLSRAEIVRLGRRRRQPSSVADCTSAADKKDPTRHAELVLKSYQHHAHQEHPMYHTTSNQYGTEPPTVATLTAERVARNQAFSNSFNSIKFRDTGLNTSVIRSQVHDALDLF